MSEKTEKQPAWPHPKSAQADAAEKIEKGSFYIFLGGLFSIIFGYLLYLIFGRFLLSKEQFGVFGVVTTFIFLIDSVVSASISRTVSKFVAERPSDSASILRKAFAMQLAFSALLFAFLSFFSREIASLLFNDASLGPFMAACSLLLLAHPLLSVYLGYLNGSRRFITQGKMKLFYAVARVFFPAALFVLGFGLVGALSAFAVPAFLLLFFSIIAFRLIPSAEKFPAHRIVSFTAPLLLFNFTLSLLHNIDLLALKAFSAPEISNLLAGNYTAASTIAKVPVFMVESMVFILFPLAAASIYNGRAEKTGYYIRATMRYSLMILVPLSLLIFSTSGELIRLIYGAKFAEASQPLSILAFSLIFYALFMVLSAVISTTKPHFSTAIGLAALGISLALNFLLVPSYGMTGAATASLMAMISAFLLSAGYVLWKHRALASIASTAKIFAASLLVCAPTIFFKLPGLLLVLEYAALAALYFGILFALKELKEKDFEIFSKMLG